MVAFPPVIKYCCRKSLPLICSTHTQFCDPAKSLGHAHLLEGGSCHRNHAYGRQVLRIYPGRSKNIFGLELTYHLNRIKLDIGTLKVLTTKVHSSFHMTTCEGLPEVSSRDGTSRASLYIDMEGSSIEVVGAPSVSEIDVRRAVDSSPFKQWLSNLKAPAGILTSAENGGASCSLKRVIIQSVDMFGQRVGFIKFKAEVIDDTTGKKLPGIVFARGGAVGILILLECDGEKYAVLTEQARVPVGRVILELPAGMLDDDAGDFVGTAAREVEEETGIHIKSADLIDLTGFLDESTGRKMFPSPGGCDEEITLLLYRGHVKREVIESLHGQQTGLRDHGEFIKVHVVPYNSLWRVTADSKALAAITLYEMAQKEGILQPLPKAPDLSGL